MFTLLAAFVLAAVMIALNGVAYRVNALPTVRSILRSLGVAKYPQVENAEGDVAVHFIDVGQGDCILIDTGETAVLIDSGEVGCGEGVVEYLDSCGIRKLDYVIATHPHSDHIGGMPEVLAGLSVGQVVFAPLPDSKIPMSKVYEDMLDIIEEKDIPVYDAQPGERLRIGQGTYLDIIAPLHNDYDNLNDFSVVTRLIHGSNTFLFTGDMERASENDVLNSGAVVASNVLKVAHHGSTSSSTSAFLKAVSPQYAVISVGSGNSYGHPKDEVLKRLEDVGAQILRTDELGTIVFVSDGGSISVHTAKYGEMEAA